jgi:hypothetical protein
LASVSTSAIAEDQAQDQRVAEQLLRRREVAALALVFEAPGHRREVGLYRLEQRGRPGGQHRALGIARHQRRHEHRAVQVVQPRRRQRRRPLCGQHRQGGAVVDQDGAGGQPRAQVGDDRVDHRVVLQRQVHAGSAAHRLGRRRGRRHAEGGQALSLVRRAVPCRDLVAALCRRFREGGAEQAGADKCNVRHGRVPCMGDAQELAGRRATDWRARRALSPRTAPPGV